MKKIFIKIITFYQKYFSLAKKTIFAGSCRYWPTCSDYAKQAITKYGIFKGGILSLKRIVSCHPLAGFGHNPVK